MTTHIDFVLTLSSLCPHISSPLVLARPCWYSRIFRFSPKKKIKLPEPKKMNTSVESVRAEVKFALTKQPGEEQAAINGDGHTIYKLAFFTHAASHRPGWMRSPRSCIMSTTRAVPVSSRACTRWSFTSGWPTMLPKGGLHFPFR